MSYLTCKYQGLQITCEVMQLHQQFHGHAWGCAPPIGILFNCKAYKFVQTYACIFARKALEHGDLSRRAGIIEAGQRDSMMGRVTVQVNLKDKGPLACHLFQWMLLK